MEIHQLRTFLAVLEHGTLSRAAEALRVGQSTVTFHLQTLEGRVGARLIDRGGGRARPTAAGRVLRRYAERLLSLHAEALACLRAEESGAAGRLAIAASTIPAEHLLPPLLVELRRRHPNVAVTVEVSDSRAALAALLDQRCDLALVGARARDRRLVLSPWIDDEVVLVGRAGGTAAPAGRLARAQLARVPLVLREEGSGTRGAAAALLARAAADGGPPPVQVGSTEAARRCALAGLGLTLISRRAVAEDLAAGRLAVIDVPGTPIRRRFYAARLRGATLPAAARTLLALIGV